MAEETRARIDNKEKERAAQGRVKRTGHGESCFLKRQSVTWTAIKRSPGE
jgi:hypothetical protein